jgi:hypothetical protein
VVISNLIYIYIYIYIYILEVLEFLDLLFNKIFIKKIKKEEKKKKKKKKKGRERT